MSEFLTFRKMVTPFVIQLLFWLGLLGVIGTAIFMMTVGDEPLIGVLTLILGPLVVRIYAELMIVAFRIHSSLNELVKISRASSTPAGQPASTWQQSAATQQPGAYGQQSPPPGSSGPSSPPSGPPSGPPPSGPPSS